MIADVHETHYDPRKIEFETGQPQAILNASKIMPNWQRHLSTPASRVGKVFAYC